MGQGFRGFFRQPVALPALMPEEEVEAQFKVPPPAPTLPTFMPFAVVRRHNPEIAAQLELLWGYPGFAKYVESITARGSERRGPPLRPEVLGAILALDRYHADNRGKKLGSIFVRVPDPMAGPTVRVTQLG